MQTIENGADGPRHLQICFFRVCTHVVAFALFAAMENQIHRAAMVLHPDPIADVAAGAVDWDRFVRKTLADDCRREFFAVLPGAVVVGAIGDRGIETVGAAVSTHHQVAGRFACRIRTVGCIGRLFGEKAFVSETAVHLISGDVVKARRIKTILRLPVLHRFI